MADRVPVHDPVRHHARAGRPGPMARSRLGRPSRDADRHRVHRHRDAREPVVDEQPDEPVRRVADLHRGPASAATARRVPRDHGRRGRAGDRPAGGRTAVPPAGIHRRQDRRRVVAAVVRADRRHDRDPRRPVPLCGPTTRPRGRPHTITARRRKRGVT